jgi:hypothetical protein
MFNNSFNEEVFDKGYVNFRKKIDSLCDLILQGLIAQENARSEYDKIETAYAEAAPHDTKLFRLIYKSRVERLCQQFLVEASNGN